MSNAFNGLYEFGGFRLDAETGTLWRGNDVISLLPKAAELLKLLLQREGQLVSKQEIFDLVWAGTFVEDGVLTQNIYTLRNALGRDYEGKQFIETVPRCGYRFAGHVTTANVGEQVAAVHVSGSEAAFDYDDLSADLLEEKSDGPRSANEYASSITTLHPLVSSSARLRTDVRSVPGFFRFWAFYFSGPSALAFTSLHFVERQKRICNCSDRTGPVSKFDGFRRCYSPNYITRWRASCFCAGRRRTIKRLDQTDRCRQCGSSSTAVEQRLPFLSLLVRWQIFVFPRT